ncbi:actin organization and endocytosis protein [Massospora cicadina]|nr:actin organization and endocytosis protein [Massospora cicadina]
MAYWDMGWELKPEDRANYRSIFEQRGGLGAGKLTSSQVWEVLGQSRLPKGELLAIWALVDPSRSRDLDLTQFSAAMHLVFGRMAGWGIPAKLPEPLLRPDPVAGSVRVGQTGTGAPEGEILGWGQPRHLGSSADRVDELHRLKESIRSVYARAPAHHPDLFPRLLKDKLAVEAKLKPYNELANLLTQNPAEARCEAIKHVIRELSITRLEIFKDPIAIKAAAMLAQRMRKLNLAPSIPPDASARVASYTSELEAGETRALAEASELLLTLLDPLKAFTYKLSKLNSLSSEVATLAEEFGKFSVGKFVSGAYGELVSELTSTSSLPTHEPPNSEVEAEAAAEFPPDPGKVEHNRQPVARRFSSPPDPGSDPLRVSNNPWEPHEPKPSQRAPTPLEAETGAKPFVKDFALLFSNLNEPNREVGESLREADEGSKHVKVEPPDEPIDLYWESMPTPNPHPTAKAQPELKLTKGTLSADPFGLSKSPPPPNVQAHYDYAEDGSELQFKAGEVLEVVEASGEWYLGHRAVGWFPRAYVSAEVTLGGPTLGQGQPYKLLYDYAPLDDAGVPTGEPLLAGVPVDLVDDTDPDWWLVQDPRPGHGGPIYVPAAFLEPSPIADP